MCPLGYAAVKYIAMDYLLSAVLSGLLRSKQSFLIAGEKKNIYAMERMHGTRTERCPSHVSSSSWTSTHVFAQRCT